MAGLARTSRISLPTFRERKLSQTELESSVPYVRHGRRHNVPAIRNNSTKPKAHCVFIDTSNKNVYVPVLGADHVMQFKFDANSGMLTPNDPPTIATKEGAGPRHFTIHPNGKWGYLITETTATIGTYSIDNKGTLTEVAYVDTGDYNQKDSAFASDIRITPNGKFLYGAVRSTSMLHGYMIDQEKGPLTGVGKWSTEKTPRGFNIDPRGNFLLAVGLDSASLTVHALDPQSGELKGNIQWASNRTGSKSSI